MNVDFWWSIPTALIDTYSLVLAGSDGINSRVNSVTSDRTTVSPSGERVPATAESWIAG